ncbi:hypothetical protein [Peribacillus sp. Bi134]|nr:hypothetical protein [Peribacillus sp. Bi134]
MSSVSVKLVKERKNKERQIVRLSSLLCNSWHFLTNRFGAARK